MTITKDRLAPADGTAFSLTVDYSKSLDRLVRVGGYDYACPEINEDNFPVDLSNGRVEVEIDAVLMHLDRSVTGDEAMEELRRRNLRPATMFELLAFGVEYPDQPHQHSIVELGSTWEQPWSEGITLSVGFLEADPEGNMLGLDGFHMLWVPSVRFLASTK